MGRRPDYIFGQFRETAQHGDGVCCAFAPQLVIVIAVSHYHRIATGLLHRIVLFVLYCETLAIITASFKATVFHLT